MEQSGAARVDAAYEALAGVAIRTPLQRSDRHSAAIGSRVWLKREDLQAVRSYKLRGAYSTSQLRQPATSPAPPTGTTRTSGARPNCSAISRTTVP